MGYEIDFIHVGQGEDSGDAIALRFGNLFGDRSEQTIVVIDGGFKESAEDLVTHIKEYYQTNRVDLVVSTHPDADHAAGLEIVIDKLEVDCLWLHQPWNHTDDIARLFKDGRVTDRSIREALRRSLDTARNLERLAQAKRIPIIEPFTGVQDASGCLTVLGPTISFYESLLPDFRGTPEPKEAIGLLTRTLAEAKEFIHRIAETWDYETLDDSGETTAENNTSTILLLTTDNTSMLFTADAAIPALTQVIDLLESIGFDFSTLSFIQTPHHGSRRSVGPSILDRLLGKKRKEDVKLKTAFVSASKGGEPKHPSKKVTNAFRRRGVWVHSTQGSTKRQHYNAPDRGWKESTPLPFYDEVEE